MFEFLVRRAFIPAVTLLLISLIVFAGVRAIPGDPARVLAGTDADAAGLEEIREKYGLNAPLPVQHARWLGLALRGDLGESIRTRQSVAGTVARKLPITSRLVLEASVIDADEKCALSNPDEVSAKRKFVSCAMNDAVITAGAPFRMIELLVGPEADPGVRFLGDGIIVATPSGSTAYSMSAGGPILSPMLEAICITPMSPQSLSFRPIVMSSQISRRGVQRF